MAANLLSADPPRVRCCGDRGRRDERSADAGRRGVDGVRRDDVRLADYGEPALSVPGPCRRPPDCRRDGHRRSLATDLLRTDPTAEEPAGRVLGRVAPAGCRDARGVRLVLVWLAAQSVPVIPVPGPCQRSTGRLRTNDGRSLATDLFRTDPPASQSAGRLFDRLAATNRSGAMAANLFRTDPRPAEPAGRVLGWLAVPGRAAAVLRLVRGSASATTHDPAAPGATGGVFRLSPHHGPGRIGACLRPVRGRRPWRPDRLHDAGPHDDRACGRLAPALTRGEEADRGPGPEPADRLGRRQHRRVG